MKCHSRDTFLNFFKHLCLREQGICSDYSLKSSDGRNRLYKERLNLRFQGSSFQNHSHILYYIHCSKICLKLGENCQVSWAGLSRHTPFISPTHEVQTGQCLNRVMRLRIAEPECAPDLLSVQSTGSPPLFSSLLSHILNTSFFISFISTRICYSD